MLLIEIFDVGHGACALVTASNGVHMMIDCGHRASPLWRPGDALWQRRIAALDILAVTNYDEDHVSGIENLFDRVTVNWLFRNTSVAPATIRQLKTQDRMGNGIRRLVRELEARAAAPHGGPADAPSLAGVQWNTFANRYPLFDDENNLSMIVWLEFAGVSVMFCGDMEQKGFAPLLQNPTFVDCLRRTTIFVAPHHGRESGCCNDVAQHLVNCSLVVISDKPHVYDTQRTNAHYASIAKGAWFNREQRKVVTTRNDGTLTFGIEGDGTWTASGVR